MKETYSFRRLLTSEGDETSKRMEWFASVNLGIVQALLSGVLSIPEAITSFYHADYVRKELRNRTADAIMARGVQLPDLFDALPAEEAQREFYRESETMRVLALKLLAQEQSSEQAVHVPA